MARDHLLRCETATSTSLIAAPKSTQNQSGERDPEMHQTKKGNEWYFGMKVHIGVDAATGYIHTLTGTSANMHDVTETSRLIRGDDHVVYGNSGYLGALARSEIGEDEAYPRLNFVSTSVPRALKRQMASKVSTGTKRWNMISLLCGVK